MTDNEGRWRGSGTEKDLCKGLPFKIDVISPSNHHHVLPTWSSPSILRSLKGVSDGNHRGDTYCIQERVVKASLLKEVNVSLYSLTCINRTHPDRQPNATPAQRKIFTEKFQVSSSIQLLYKDTKLQYAFTYQGRGF